MNYYSPFYILGFQVLFLVEKQFGLYMEQVDNAMPKTRSNHTTPTQGSQSASASAKPELSPTKKGSSDGANDLVQKQSGQSEGGLCPICRKTQLARGCGHKCGFCLTLICSRCGGKAQV